jgi:hypothetical protein
VFADSDGVGPIVSADWDGDGRTDLAVLNLRCERANPCKWRLDFLPGQGRRSFGLKTLPLDGDNWNNILLSGDWNVDGRIDCLLVRWPSEIVTLVNVGK